jgi:DNA-3-methyladenine glycosylase
MQKPLASLAPLPRSFYARDPRLVARDLLGKLLVSRAPADRAPSSGQCGNELLAGRIVEAEAYLGAIDPGSHAYRGQTPRNAVLFGPSGHAYIYFIYGNHYCTNVSCRAAGMRNLTESHPTEPDKIPYAGGVLLRALEPVYGLQAMAELRGLTLPAAPTRPQLRQLTSGPGRLSQALGITRERDNACDLCSSKSTLYIADDGHIPAAISATPRINVTHAPLDEWRFIISGNPFVSGKKLP